MTDTTQRWRFGRDYYRQRATDFRPGDFGVEPMESSAEAKDFVRRHHYSGTMPANRLRVGLYRARRWFTPELVGVAVFAVSMHQGVIPHYAPGLTAAQGLELGRLILLEDVPYNAETWMLTRAFQVLRKTLPEVQVVLSFSDPVPRMGVEGRVVMPGHVGSIYQGKGARYVGRSASRVMILDQHGRAVSERGRSKIRNEERGWENEVQRLLQVGAPRRRQGESPREWLARALMEGPFRRVPHPGNHAYLFDSRGTANGLPFSLPALPYPKKHG